MSTHLILDTHVVLEWLLWDSPRHAELRALMPANTIVWRSAETEDELLRVLGYAALKVDAERQAKVVASFQTQSQLHVIEVPANLPRCKDPDDQKFLELAWSLSQHLMPATNPSILLLTRDKRLLKIARHPLYRNRFRTQTPEQFQISGWQALPVAGSFSTVTF